MCNADGFVGIEMIDKVVDIDNLIEPELCATITADIYKYLRASEVSHFFSTVETNVILFFFSSISMISFK